MDRNTSGPIANIDEAGSEGRAAPAPSQIGEALWRARMRSGLSVEQVADRTGTDQAMVAAIEDSDFAHMAPSETAIDTAKAYARLMSLPVKWVATTLADELAATRISDRQSNDTKGAGPAT